MRIIRRRNVFFAPTGIVRGRVPAVLFTLGGNARRNNADVRGRCVPYLTRFGPTVTAKRVWHDSAGGQEFRQRGVNFPTVKMFGHVRFLPVK